MNLEQHIKQEIINLIKEKKLKPLNKKECKSCGTNDFPRMTYKVKNNGMKAECKHCGAYIGFLKHRDIEVLEDMGDMPSVL